MSAGDVFRQQIADAEAKAEAERQRAEEEKLNTVRKMVDDGVLSIDNAMAYFGYSKEQILTK